jgi:hypothetical protein
MTFEQDKDETPVIFRIERRKGGVVTAVFPCEPAAMDGRTMTCYAHVGQHGGCSHQFVSSGRAAKPEEYADLKAELESAPYGYRLKVYKRVQPAHRKAFDAEVRRLQQLARAS